MDDLDRALVGMLQDGIEIAEQPFAAPAATLGITEAEVVERIGALLDAGVLTRFGPMFDAARLGGAFTLCAMAVPAHEFEAVSACLDRMPEVAHNYEREHHFNMWFVLATERPEDIAGAIARIESETGLDVLDLPKQEEYYIGLRIDIASGEGQSRPTEKRKTA